MFLARVIILSLLLSGLAATEAKSQDATRAGAPVSRLPANHSPDGALIRSLLIPGWGQVYNKQYWKLPFVYAGVGGMVWVSVKATRKHRLYTRAYQFLANKPPEGTEHPFPGFEDEYLEVLQRECGNTSCTPSQSSLKQLRDNFRRNRDLSRFGIGLVYGLSVIDAFVSAHLLDFDVSEDLTLQLLPHPAGATALLRIGL